MPNYDALRQNLIDVVKEGQQKLGYLEGPVRLNYPVDSLNRLLETDLDVENLKPVLVEFRRRVRDELGEIGLGLREGRFVVTVPPQGARFVHEQVADSPFLAELLDLLARRPAGLSIEEIRAVFARYGEAVCKPVEDEEEFNYVLYFPGGKPDSYRYLLDLDRDHATYHRLTPGDYYAFGFSD